MTLTCTQFLESASFHSLTRIGFHELETTLSVFLEPARNITQTIGQHPPFLPESLINQRLASRPKRFHHHILHALCELLALFYVSLSLSVILKDPPGAAQQKARDDNGQQSARDRMQYKPGVKLEADNQDQH